MSNLKKFLSLIIFIVAIWSVNSFLLPKVHTETKNMSTSKEELAIKQLFNDGSPSKLAKFSNEFVLKQFDKNQLVNLIDTLAQQSGIRISSLDVQTDSSNRKLVNAELDSEVLDVNTSQNEFSANTTKTNTLKNVNLSIRFSGSKSSIDLFLSKLAESNQYIDIHEISIAFSTQPESATVSQIVESTIIAKVYYINL